MATRLDKLMEKRDALEKQIKEAQAKDRAKTRQLKTRRKTLAGALALSHMEEHPQSNFTKTLKGLLDEHVTKPNDRELFGLEPLPEESPEGKQQENAA